MLKKFTSLLNFIILGSFILVFEHISRYSYFGFLYPWIDFILTSFVIYFSITMPHYFKKPQGLYTLLIGILFISIQFITSSSENFKSTVVYITFIVIVSIVAKNSDPKKLNDFIRIITYCCLINLIFAFYSIIVGDASVGRVQRIGGLDQAPVQFGYVMLLGFWLVLMNSITQKDPNKSPTILDKLIALAFVVGILLSKSAGAIIGLGVGILFVIIFSKKIINFFLSIDFLLLISFCFLAIIIYVFFPWIFWDVLGFNRYVGKFVALQNLLHYQETFSEARSVLWSSMLKAYIDEFTFLKFFFGGGQGHGTDLTGRGVHSDHLKFLFDHGIIGLFIYYFKIFSCLKLVSKFNIFLIGFIASTLASGIFYVNFGSINNSFGCILTITVLSNYNTLKKFKS